MRGSSRLVWGIALAASAAALTLVVSACGPKTPPVNAAYRAEVERWRAQRLVSLTSEDGWLTLAGLYWLKPGENRFGADPGNEVVLHGRAVPVLAGSFELAPDGSVTVHPRPEAGVTLGGQPAPARALRSDHDLNPDVDRKSTR